MPSAPRLSNSDLRAVFATAGKLRWFYGVIVVLTVSLTLFVWAYSHSQLQVKLRSQFDRETDRVVGLIVERMSKYEEVLLAGVAHLSITEGGFDNRQWERYAGSIQIEKRYPGINGIGVILHVQHAHKPLFIEQQRDWQPLYDIHPLLTVDEYWPIAAIVPLGGNEQALGLDMGHELNRLTAAKQARDTGMARVTGPIVLVQDSKQTPGFLFYSPFYRNGIQQSVWERQQNFVGFVYAPFVFSKLIGGTLHRDQRFVGFNVTDSGTLLYDELNDSNSEFDADPLFKRVASISMFGRNWDFEFWSSQTFRAGVDRALPTTILIAGFLINGLLIGLFVLLSRRSRQASRVADQVGNYLEKLKLAAEVNQIGIWDYNPTTGGLEWDDTMFALYGRERSQFAGAYEAWTDSLHPDDRAASERALSAALSSATTFDSEFRIIQASGEVRYLCAKAVIFRDSEAKPVRMLGANMDITDRKLAVCELEANRRLQQAIQEAAGVSIIATDLEGRIVIFNNAAQRMLGYQAEELLHKKTPATFHDLEEVCLRAEELSLEFGREIKAGFEVFVAKVLDGQSEQREWTYVRKDGSKLPVLLTVTALRSEDNTITGFLGIAADISERKLAVESIKEANTKLARSNEDLAQFAYVASHDLQEPLRKVVSFCELLEEDCGEQLSSDAKIYMEYIMDGGRRMRALIQDLLAYSRIDSDGRSGRQVDAHETVLLAIENLSEAIHESQAAVTFDELPIVSADPSQLTQLFQNLIGNAIKYHGDESPRVHISCKVAGLRCIFAVKDNGIGIAPEYREQVFGVFKRLHDQRKYKGTGIGLAVCKRIVERAGGRIWIDGPPAGGSVFHFDLPLGIYPALPKHQNLLLGGQFDYGQPKVGNSAYDRSELL